MSVNQSKAERSNSSQYRRSGRSGSSAQPRNFSGGSGKGGGSGPAPPPSINSSLSSNRSYKKSNNAQGGQSRGSSAVVNTDSNYASAVRTLQNGAHLQPSAHGAADAPVGVSVKPTADMSTQKSPQAVPKAPSSQPSTVNSDSTAPATPAKASGEASKSFPLQFGSISPGFMNGMQIPARNKSAPPNLDEQQCDQFWYLYFDVCWSCCDGIHDVWRLNAVSILNMPQDLVASKITVWTTVVNPFTKYPFSSTIVCGEVALFNIGGVLFRMRDALHCNFVPWFR